LNTFIERIFSGPERICHVVTSFAIHRPFPQDAPNTVEYALMLALISVVFSGAITTFAHDASIPFRTVGNWQWFRNSLTSKETHVRSSSARAAES
jgi:Flp pilus assembly pilin Flp